MYGYAFLMQTMKVTFEIHYNTHWGETVALILGGRKYPMEWNDGGLWKVTVEARAEDLEKYGYVLMRDGLIARMEWSDHSVHIPAGAKKTPVISDSWIECPIPDCPFVRQHAAAEFDVPGFRGAGVVIPVFSLRGSRDFGIGEFNDLHTVVDWAAKLGLCVIQLLPVTDTTRHGGWEDSYPYSPVSSFALHPMYINLQDAGVKEDSSFKKTQAALNALPKVDYPRVFKEKMALLRKAFAANGKRDMATAEFQAFCKENGKIWMNEYSEFCAKRDGDSPDFWRWVQWNLDRQFASVVNYARSKGVHFKGDLPIGVSADSADAYFHPELFNLDSFAGAPPDFFSKDGQCWGFPTYNWDEMAKDGYAWWKARLRHMSRYFDAFRIDHILGFFRIWEIPAEKGKGLFGHFNPALSYSEDEIKAMYLPFDGLFNPDPRNENMWQPRISPDTSALEWWQKQRFDGLYDDFFYHRNEGLWRRNALRKLPELLRETGMLACGEDLGMVPACVNGVMSELGILSLEMAMMDKGRPWPALSVCATSSHDMDTLRMQYARSHGGNDMPLEEVRASFQAHFGSASMLAIFPLQDYLALSPELRSSDFMSERINEPSDPHHHWCYRLHLDVAALCEADALNAEISGLLEMSGR